MGCRAELPRAIERLGGTWKQPAASGRAQAGKAYATWAAAPPARTKKPSDNPPLRRVNRPVGLFYWVMSPRMAALRAPVAEGRFEGSRLQDL